MANIDGAVTEGLIRYYKETVGKSRFEAWGVDAGENIFTHQLFLQVKIISDEALKVKLHYLDTDGEGELLLFLGIHDFLIKKAEIIEYRIEGKNPLPIIRVKGVEGIPAYFGSTSKIRDIVIHEAGERWADLFTEIIKGLIYC